MLYNSLLPHSPVLHCEEGVVLHKAHVDHMFREGNAAQCLASFFEHLSKGSLHHEIIDQPKRIVSTSDTTTLSPEDLARGGGLREPPCPDPEQYIL